MKQSVPEKGSSTCYGTLMMTASALLFSTGGLLCKMIPWSALAINSGRTLIAAVLTGVYLKITHHKLKINPTVLLGAVCIFMMLTLYVSANKLTTAANAIVIQYSAPVWIILLMAILFHARPTRLDVVTIGVVFTGILCFFCDSLGSGNLLGDLLALCSGFFYACLFMMNSFESGDSLSSLFFGELASGILLLPFVFQESSFSPGPVAAILFMGIFQVGAAYLCFNEGTRCISPVASSLICGIEPVLNPVLVAIFWNETLQPLSLAGAVIVISAVLIYNIRK